MSGLLNHKNTLPLQTGCLNSFATHCNEYSAVAGAKKAPAGEIL